MNANLFFRRISAKLKTRNQALGTPIARPPCFANQAAFDAWMAESISFAASTNVNPSNYCVDCLPEFQRRMKAANRCAHPDVEFVSYDGGIYGRRP